MNSKKRLVLMSCCAPCSCGAIKQLADGKIEGFDDFIVVFYNPNIFPESEYQKRLYEQIKYCQSLGVKYHVGQYNHKDWLDFIKGFENEPERGKRCSLCFKFRFEYAKNFALENGYDAVASVFGVSRHKDQSQVDKAATDVMGNKFYISVVWDEKLRNEINHQSDFYRQNYCGCEFSMRRI